MNVDLERWVLPGCNPNCCSGQAQLWIAVNCHFLKVCVRPTPDRTVTDRGGENPCPDLLCLYHLTASVLCVPGSDAVPRMGLNCPFLHRWPLL